LASFIEIFRWLVWVAYGLSERLLSLVYSIVKEIVTVNMWNIQGDSSSLAMSFWYYFATLFNVAVAVRLLYEIAKLLADNNENKMIAEKLLKKVLLVIVCTVAFNLLPEACKAISSTSNKLIDVINVDDNEISTLILRAVAVDNIIVTEEMEDMVKSKYKPEGIVYGTRIDDSGTVYEDAQTMETWSWLSADRIEDINEYVDKGIFGNTISWAIGSVDYVYFGDVISLILLAGLNLYAALLFCMVGLDIAKRFFEALTLLLIAFIPISSIVSNGEQFKTWLKLYFNLFVSNFLEFFLVIAVVSIVGLLQSKVGFFALCIFTIAGFLFAMNGSRLVAQLLGVETSGNTMQEMFYAGQVLGGAAKMASGVFNAGKNALSNGAGLAAGLALGGIGSQNYGKETENIMPSRFLNNANGDNEGGNGFNNYQEQASQNQALEEAKQQGNAQAQDSGAASQSATTEGGASENANALAEASQASTQEAVAHPTTLNGEPVSEGNNAEQAQQQSRFDEIKGNLKAATKAEPYTISRNHRPVQQNSLWKEGSTGERFQKWAMGSNSRIKQGVYKKVANTYERRLINKQKKRGYR